MAFADQDARTEVSATLERAGLPGDAEEEEVRHDRIAEKRGGRARRVDDAEIATSVVLQNQKFVGTLDGVGERHSRR